MLWASYTAAVVVLMDLTAVNIALPSISDHFGISPNEVSRLLMISMLTASSFALIAGRLIEIINPKLLFFTGFLVFFLGTFSCFLVKDFYILLGIRFVQGFAESLIYVIGPALIRKHMDLKKQQKAYGIWMMCTGIGISMGPVIGGFLVAGFDWNWVFLINVPLCLAGLFFVIRMQNESMSGEYRNSRFDIPGAIFSFLFLTGLIYGLNTANKEGWGSPIILISLFISLLSLGLFIRHEKSAKHPLFDLKLFRIRNFSLTNLGFFLYFIVNVGSRFLRPFYFEEGRGLSTEVSGILMMISPLVMIIISPMAKSLSRFVHPRRVCNTGNIFLFTSMLMFSTWDQHTSFVFLTLSMVILGVGMGLYYPTSSFIGMISLPDGRHGMGSAAISTSKSMGKLMGVLVFGFTFTILLSGANGTIAKAGHETLIAAFQWTFLIGGIIGILAFMISLLLKRK